MAEPGYRYRTLDVVEAMEALGIPEDVQETFFDANKRSVTLTLDGVTDALKAAGMSFKNRVAVMKRLEVGPSAAPLPGDAAVHAPRHEPAPLPLIPYSDLMGITRLGGGAFGDVYRGTYHGGDVAVKRAGVLAADVSSIEKERRLLGSVKAHPNLVHVLGVCVDAPDGAARIVMELCQFGDLVSYTDSLPKPMSLQFVLTVFHQASHGVGHLHATPPGICHRDIRRANFLVASTVPLRICLADFGLSHVLDAGGPSSTVTQIGPVAWRAPETFTSVGGQQEVSVKTDVYMFGCFMLEVVTGREPLWWVSGGGPMQSHVRISNLDKSPLDLAEAAGMLDVSGVQNDPSVRGIVDDVMALIRRCVAASPADRPNMAAVTSALEGMREKATGPIPLEVAGTYVGGYGQVQAAYEDFSALIPAVTREMEETNAAAVHALAVEEKPRRAAEALAVAAVWEEAVPKEAEVIAAAALHARAEEEERRRVADTRAAAAAREEAARKDAEVKAAVTASATGLVASAILASVAPGRLAAFLCELSAWLPRRVYTLLYRGSRDGMTARAFHCRCDRKGPTLVLVRCEKGWVFGGHAGTSWGSGGHVGSRDAFLFSVTGPNTAAPVRFPVKADKAGSALGCLAGCGPYFNGGLCVRAASDSPSACYDGGSRCQIGINYDDVIGKRYDSLTGAPYFTPVEVEVFAITLG